MNTFCFCGRLAKIQFNGKCARHNGKEPPKRKEAQRKFRGDSKFGKENGLFKNKGE